MNGHTLELALGGLALLQGGALAVASAAWRTLAQQRKEDREETRHLRRKVDAVAGDVRELRGRCPHCPALHHHKREGTTP